ncbi:MAG: phosphatidylserine/phosphatidylglycerophosphate/cardiolipin synthase family protein [Sandaracinus sp.]|nr:phosphatidylserine/phosphatidylglycerophosphate/cardiolipin synthase family protein [Sandaracinus sp.]
MSESRGLAARLRATVRELLHSESDLVDAVADRVDAAVQRWADAAGLRRFTVEHAGDRFALLGESVELAATVGTLRRAVTEEVVFCAYDEEIARAKPDRDGVAVTVTTFDTVGHHGVEARTVGRSGHTFDEPIAELHVHVVDDKPLLFVDVAMVFAAQLANDGELARRVEALVARGWHVGYFDLAPKDRRAETFAAIDAVGLPYGGLLDHNADVDEITSLGVAFQRVFAVTALRRLRARGIGVGWVLTSDAEAVLGCTAEAVGSHGESPPDPGETEEVEAATRVFHEERRAAETAGRGISRRLDIVTRAPLREGNEIRVELDNRVAREAIFAAIDSAERDVLVQLYILEASRFTDQLAVRLVRAARRGVRVRLLVDALYSRDGVLGFSNPLVRGLGEEPGIEVVSGDPILGASDLDLLRLKNRDHRKLVVIDGHLAFVSGRNAGDAYYTGMDEVAVFDHTPHVHLPWLDAHVEVRGPLVADVQRSFLDAWTRSGGVAFTPWPIELAGDSAARLVVHLGVSDANGLLAYEAMLDGARSHVYVVNDFPVVASLAMAVRRAVARGVRVVFLTGSALARRADGTFFDGPKYRELFEHLTKHRLEPLAQAGVEVFEYQTPRLPDVVALGGVFRPYVHAKLVSVDGLVASAGSANLDVTASYWEREANVVVEDPVVVGELERQLEALIATSVPLDRESEVWKREATQRELVARLWPSVVYS